jgi:NTP pyrophosphatase (non-canonical NTP hydrolase)
MDSPTIEELIVRSHNLAKEKGWYEGPEVNVPEKLMLIVSEISEALEEYRYTNAPHIWFGDDGKPEGFTVELADAIIRICDLAGHMGLDLTHALNAKHEYNQTRAYRHGGKKC